MDEPRAYGSNEQPQQRAPRPRIRTRHFAKAKREGIKIVGLTSYDFLSASIFDRADIDFLLVGDSAGNTVFGYDTTLPVTIEELLPLTAAVARAAERALVVADMPFGSYEAGAHEALHNATRFMKEAGAHAVKLEGGERVAKQMSRLVEAGIPVMGHIGFTPQSEHGLGGHVIQGKGDAGLEQLMRDARAVEEAGAFAMVIEMVPSDAAKAVTEAVSIPTLSVGAGPHCDGQLLVWTDWAGLSTGRTPRFVKQYAQLAQTLTDAVHEFQNDVHTGAYPAPEHEYQQS